MLDRLSKDILVVIVGITALAAMAYFAVLSFRDVPRYRCEEASVIVQPGDTAWSIVSQHCEGHIGNAVYDMGFSGNIYPGQRIEIRSVP